MSPKTDAAGTQRARRPPARWNPPRSLGLLSCLGLQEVILGRPDATATAAVVLGVRPLLLRTIPSAVGVGRRER